MKTTINVTAPAPQYNLHAISTIAREIITSFYCDYERGKDGCYTIVFKTRKEARKAIREAYNELKEDGADKSRENNWLRYDGATAEIEGV